MRIRPMIRKFGVMMLVLCALSGALVTAQISITTVGPQYRQNFDSIGTAGTASLPSGWKTDSGTATTAYASAASATTLAAGTSGTGALTGTSGGGSYNFANGVTASSTDRSVGWLSTGSFSSPRQLFVQITNNTGATLTQLAIAYDLEKYRTGTRAWSINFFSSTDGSTWNAQTAGDQAYAADGANAVVNPPTTINKTLTLSGLNIANGSSIYLRWAYTGTGGSTNAQGIGLDNFSVRAVANLAYDSAAETVYGSGTFNALNGGTGFSAWSNTNGTNSGFFGGRSDGNGAAADSNNDDDVETYANGNMRSWGMYANTGEVASAVRTLTTALKVGDMIGFKFDNGYIDNGATVGWGLRNASGTNMLEMYFIGGDTGYKVNDSGGSVLISPTLGFTDEGYSVVVTITGSSTYSMVITQLNGGASRTVTGTFAATGPVAQFRAFNAFSGSGSTKDAFFNELWANDPIAPTVTSIVRQTPSSATTNASSVVYRVTFSEPMSDATINTADFTVTAGGPTGASVSGVSSVNSTTYDVTVNTGSGDGSLRLDVLSGTATVNDAAGNSLTASYTSGETFTIDKTAPIVSSIVRQTPAGSATNGSSVVYRVTFSKAMSAATIGTGDFTVTASGPTGASVTGVSTVNTTTYDVTVNTGSGDGTLRLDVLNATATVSDTVGNALVASYTAGQSYSIDKTAPTAGLSLANSAINNLAAVTFNVTLSEPLSNLTTSNFSVTTTIPSGVTIATVNPVGPEPTANWTVSVDTGTGGGQLALRFANSTGVADAAGNAVSGLPVTSSNYTIDQTAPAVAVSSAAATNVNAPFSVTVTFSENVTGFSASGVSVTNGSAGAPSGGPAVYTVLITPSAQGTVSVDIPPGVAQDQAGNGNSGAPTPLNRNYDSVSPSISSRIPDIAAVVNALPSVTIEFDEAVTGVTFGALTVNGQAATGVTGSGTGPYVFTGYTAPADGTVTIALTGTGIIDATGNVVANTNWNITKNSAAVTVTLTAGTLVDNDRTNINPIPFTATFSEAVSGFVAGDISVTGGGAGNFVPVSGSIYTFEVTPSGQGAVAVSISAGVATATAPPNNANSASAAFNLTYDSVAPTVTLTPSATGSTNAPFTVDVDFSELVIGFDSSDVVVTNATLSGFLGSGASYSVTVNPTSQGPVSVSVNANAAQDQAGNNNTAATPVNLTYDSVRPSVSISSTAPQPTNTSPVPFRITFGENVTGFVQGDVSAAGGTIGSFTPVSGTIYDLTVIPSGAESTISVDVPQNVAADAAGNLNTAAASSVRDYDSVAPTVTLSSAVGAQTNAAFGVTATFSEAVSGFAGGDVTATGATVGSISGSGPYTFTVSPTAEGPVNVSIAAGAAQDAAGNSSVASSNSISTTYDITAPNVTIGAANLTVVNSAATVSFPVTISGASSINLGAGQVTLTPSGGVTGTVAVLNGTTANPTVQVSSLSGNGSFTISIASGVASDAATNISVVAGPSASVTVDNVAPQVVASFTATTTRTIEVSFSEAPGTGALTPANYTLSGPSNLLNPHPDQVQLVSGVTYRLTWNAASFVASGGFLNGELSTLTVSGLQDLAGNPIDVGYDTASGVVPVELSAFTLE